MIIANLTRADVIALIAHLQQTTSSTRIAIDGGVKVSNDQRMWTLPFGTTQEG